MGAWRSVRVSIPLPPPFRGLKDRDPNRSLVRRPGLEPGAVPLEAGRAVLLRPDSKNARGKHNREPQEFVQCTTVRHLS